LYQLVGKDSLGESDKVILEIAKLLREDFLQQNSYTTYDCYCPFFKTVGMMKNFVLFHNLAQKAIEDSASTEDKITWVKIKNAMAGLLTKLSQMKFQDPTNGEQKIKEYYAVLSDEIHAAFRNLGDA